MKRLLEWLIGPSCRNYRARKGGDWYYVSDVSTAWGGCGWTQHLDEAMVVLGEEHYRIPTPPETPKPPIARADEKFGSHVKPTGSSKAIIQS